MRNKNCLICELEKLELDRIRADLEPERVFIYRDRLLKKRINYLIQKISSLSSLKYIHLCEKPAHRERTLVLRSSQRKLKLETLARKINLYKEAERKYNYYKSKLQELVRTGKSDMPPEKLRALFFQSKSLLAQRRRRLKEVMEAK